MEVVIEGFPVAYILPPQPPLKEIAGSELPKKNQKWVKPHIPSDEEAADLSDIEREEIIEREYRRRLYGYWFMNNGEPTYITGAHYFYMCYWFIGADTFDGYPEYRKASRFRHYIRDICDKDTNCFGLIMVTSKRQGKTEEAISNLYNAATLIETESLFGMQSLTATEAKNNLFKSRLMRSHKRIPNYLKPVSNESQGTKEIASELTFLGQKVAGGKYKDGLNNVIDWRPTIASAYQGKKPKKIFFDEPASLKELDLGLWWSTVKEQLSLGKKINGKAELPSTLEEFEKVGGTAFKKIFFESDYHKRDKNGRTDSGLYSYVQPYYTGRETFIDEYGDDLEEEAKQFRQNQIENKGSAEAMKIRRQYPADARDAFLVNDQFSPFDTQKLNDQLKFNELNPQVLKTGNFYWIDGIRFGKVGFAPHAEGRFNIAWFCDDNLRNNQKIVNGRLAPANDLNGGFGLDSFSARSTVGKNGSNCALYGILTPSMNRDYPFFFLEYLYRAATPEEQAEDVLKACIFYGMPVLGERNTLTVYNFFFYHGFENYLQLRPRDPWEVVTPAQRQERWIPNVSDAQRTDLVSYTMAFIQQHVGVNDLTGKMGEMYFNKLIKCWLNFDPTERWTPYDEFIGAAYALASINRPKIQKQKSSYMPPIVKYDNSGLRSRRLS